MIFLIVSPTQCGSIPTLIRKPREHVWHCAISPLSLGRSCRTSLLAPLSSDYGSCSYISIAVDTHKLKDAFIYMVPSLEKHS
jgi:hypothetical protein